MSKRLLSTALLLLLCMTATEAASQRGKSRPPPPPPITDVHRPTQDQSSIFSSRSFEDPLAKEYYEAIRKTDLGANSEIEFYLLPQYYAEARNSGKTEHLPGDLSWLSVRTTGTQSKDKFILSHSKIVASRLFSRAWSLDQTNVLVTGMSVATTSAIEKISDPKGEKREKLQSLEAAMAEHGGKDLDAWNQAVEAALTPFSYQLLILTAHHESSSGAEGFVSVRGKHGKVQVPVAALREAARRRSVNLFIYGCSTAASTPFGTRVPLLAEQAIQGIKALFETPVTKYGQVFERLSSPSPDLLVFDIRTVVHRVFKIIDPKTHEPIGEWKIPVPRPTLDQDGALASGLKACANTEVASPLGCIERAKVGDTPLDRVYSSSPKRYLTLEEVDLETRTVPDAGVQNQSVGVQLWTFTSEAMRMLLPIWAVCGTLLVICSSNLTHASTRRRRGPDGAGSSLLFALVMCAVAIICSFGVALSTLWSGLGENGTETAVGVALLAVSVTMTFLSWKLAKKLFGFVRDAFPNNAPPG